MLPHTCRFILNISNSAKAQASMRPTILCTEGQNDVHHHVIQLRLDVPGTFECPPAFGYMSHRCGTRASQDATPSQRTRVAQHRDRNARLTADAILGSLAR